jgi:hypothetical protein
MIFPSVTIFTVLVFFYIIFLLFLLLKKNSILYLQVVLMET